MTRKTTVLEGCVQTPFKGAVFAPTSLVASFVTLYHHYAAIYVYTIYLFGAFVAKRRSAIY